MKYAVSYEIPYVHTVMIQIEADSPEEAAAKGEEMFHDLSFWDDTEEVPLLYDDYDEIDLGWALEFKAEAITEENAPVPAACVQKLRQEAAAARACKLLVEAYGRGDESDIGLAYEQALIATGRVASQPNAPRSDACSASDSSSPSAL